MFILVYGGTYYSETTDCKKSKLLYILFEIVVCKVKP